MLIFGLNSSVPSRPPPYMTRSTTSCEPLKYEMFVPLSVENEWLGFFVDVAGDESQAETISRSVSSSSAPAKTKGLSANRYAFIASFGSHVACDPTRIVRERENGKPRSEEHT